MKKFKKVIATIIAAAAMAISLISLSVSAYSPTINKPFGDGATATLYADISHASASTACPGVECVVRLTYSGLQKSGYSSDYASAYIDGNGSSPSADSYHKAGFYSTYIVF